MLAQNATLKNKETKTRLKSGSYGSFPGPARGSHTAGRATVGTPHFANENVQFMWQPQALTASLTSSTKEDSKNPNVEWLARRGEANDFEGCAYPGPPGASTWPGPQRQGRGENECSFKDHLSKSTRSSQNFNKIQSGRIPRDGAQERYTGKLASEV